MDENPQRKTLTISNEYQLRIVLVAFLPAFIICLFFNLLFALAQLGLINQIAPWVNFIVFVFSGLFVFSLILVFVVSNRLVGPFHRVVGELDEIIAGRSQKMITARPEDTIANTMLRRVNVLIQSYIQNKR